MAVIVDDIRVVAVPDEDGEFGYVGVVAEADIFVTEDDGYGTAHTVSSPGLWGIEDDSGDDYLREVGREEVEQLRGILEQMGVSEESLTYHADDPRYCV